MYADDTVIYNSSETAENSLKHQQQVLSTVLEWCNYNKLTINENKTKYSFFNNRSNTVDPSIKLQCKHHTLERVNSYKYLGVDVTDDLDMNMYVNSIYKKANYKVYMFSKIRRYITKYAAIMLYKQTILPYMDY